MDFMNTWEFKISFGEWNLSARCTQPDEGQAPLCLIYAPGAGSNINDPFGQFLSGYLAESGVASIRFQFPYMQKGKRRPDSPKLLEETWKEAIRAGRSTASKMVIGGRSMGGRIASQVAAQGTEVDALALFAYPLRPPNNPSKVRDTHLPEVTVPAFMCSGTRDSFGTPDELRETAAKMQKATFYLLDGADHGFSVLKSSGRTREDVWREAADGFSRWLRADTTGL